MAAGYHGFLDWTGLRTGAAAVPPPPAGGFIGFVDFTGIAVGTEGGPPPPPADDRRVGPFISNCGTLMGRM